MNDYTDQGPAPISILNLEIGRSDLQSQGFPGMQPVQLDVLSPNLRPKPTLEANQGQKTR